MKTVVVLGTQWGDEGKGKFVDVIAGKADAVVRFQGGNNAGHTIIIGDEKFIFQLLPSGVLYDSAQCIIGSGVVVDLKVLLKEMSILETRGRTTDHIFISDKAHLIMPYHVKLDQLKEAETNGKIGTTQRGIGPCYADKINRVGIRVADLLDEETFKQKLQINITDKNKIFKHIYSEQELSFDEMLKEFLEIKEQIKHRVINSEVTIRDHIKKDNFVVFEGAQASMLDIDFGTYPYVTSSSPSVGGLINGAGVSFSSLKHVVGIVKSYSTRVGGGPFVTEQLTSTEVGQTLLTVGAEYGSVTGRNRRCGYLDLVVVNSSVQLNGINNIVLTKLDVLSSFKEIPVCIGYELYGKTIDYVPSTIKEIERVKPIYKTFKGWQSDISEITEFDKLPQDCQDYVNYIQGFLCVPVIMISVGPKRNQNIYLKNDII